MERQGRQVHPFAGQGKGLHLAPNHLRLGAFRLSTPVDGPVSWRWPHSVHLRPCTLLELPIDDAAEVDGGPPALEDVLFDAQLWESPVPSCLA